MSNFIERKKELLNWFNEGNKIDRCSEPGHAWGNFSGIENCPIKRNLESILHRLIRDGKIRYQTFIVFGIRWERFYSPETSGELTNKITGGDNK